MNASLSARPTALGRNSRRLLLLALIIGSLAALQVQGPRLIDPYSVEEDFRNFFYMHRFQDSQLFENDPLIYPLVVEYDVGPVHLIIDGGSPGYSLFFKVASYLLPVALVSKLLVFPLLWAAIYFLFRIVEMREGPTTALAISLVFIVPSLFLHSELAVTAGLQRSFIMPLLLGQLYFLMQKQYWLAALTIFLSGVIYPIAFVIGVITYGLSLIKFDRTRRLPFTIDWPHLWPLLAAVIFVAISLLPFATRSSLTAGVVHTTETAKIPLWENPDLQSGGRRQLFEEFPLVGRAGLADSSVLFLILLVLILFALTIWCLEPASLARMPAVLKYMFLAGFFGFGLAWGVALLTSSFLAHVPSRYTQTTLFLFLFIFIGTNAREAMQRGAAKIGSLGGGLTWISLAAVLIILATWFLAPARSMSLLGGALIGQGILVALLILLLMLTGLSLRRKRPTTSNGRTGISIGNRTKWTTFSFALLFGSIWYALIFSTDYYVVPTSLRGLFTFLETLPEDVTVAGSPCVLDSIPFFAKRKVISSCENPHPDSSVIRDSLRAYYAEEMVEITDYCREYDVEYLVVNTRDFDPAEIQQGEYFFEPYDSELAPELRTQTNFALNQVAEDLKLFETGEIFVMSCPRY